jgi:dihydrolipoamide dehydrogenase
MKAAMKTYDAIVIGSGPGGYPAAIKLGQLGLKTLCIEKESAGGVCLNWGCIPSKALIYAANQYEKSKGDNNEIGIVAKNVSLDSDKLQDWKDGIVKKLTGGVKGLVKSAKADYVEGTGKLVGKDTVEVALKDGGKETFKASKGIVIATGATTIELPGFKFDGETIIGAKEAVSLRKVPKRLMVIGGGVIGLELGTVYQKMGSELTVCEALPHLLGDTDPDCTRVVERKLKKHGATIMKKAFAKGVEKTKDGLEVTVEVEGEKKKVTVDVVLVAVGMRPASKNLGLEDVGVKTDGKGFIPTDETCQTNVKGIYAVGDVSGPPLLAHKATKEGEVAAEVIAGHKAAKDWVTIPGATFTDPEIATAGITEAEAKEKGIAIKVGKFPFSVLGKAMAMRETDGFVKVIVDAESKQILGVHIVGPEASAMISEAALSLEMAAFAEDVMLTVHPHPTLGEAYMEAAAHAIGQAVHIVNR